MEKHPNFDIWMTHALTGIPKAQAQLGMLYFSLKIFYHRCTQQEVIPLKESDMD